MNATTKLLGIYVSYDEKGNNQMNFNLKVQKLQTNLDIWKSRGLTLYGKVLIIKSLGLSNLIYSISNVNFPKDIGPMVKDKMFRFLWKNKKDKIKCTSMYQDLSTGGLRMVDIELTIKSLRLAWIKRLLFRDNCNNWKIVPDYFLTNTEALISCFVVTMMSSIYSTFRHSIETYLLHLMRSRLCTIAIKETTPFSLITKTS